LGTEILVVGSCNLDLQLHVLHLPVAGKTLLAEAYARAAGGKGLNQAAAAAKLGASVAMLGAVGQDDAGAFLTQSLADAGVDISLLLKASEPTGTAAILLTVDGQNSIVVASGANNTLQPRHIREQQSRIESASIVLTQLETPLPALAEVLMLAARAAVPVMLDPAPATPLSGEVLRSIAWFTPNATEAAFYMRQGNTTIANETEALACMQALRALGPRNILLKLGVLGAGLLTEEGVAYFVRAPKVQALDTTGAGDTMNAAFAVALSNGTALHEALRFAVAAASLSVQRIGAMDAAPMFDEVSAFLKSTAFPRAVRLPT
jgi:ribokinase